MSASIAAATAKPKKQTKAAKRRKAARAARARPMLLVEPVDVGATSVRIANGTVTRSEWADPDDSDPNRRTARKISGHRSFDGLHWLLSVGSISKSQHTAGSRYRRCWELGAVGCSGSAIARLGQAVSGSSDAGPSEIKLQHLQRYQAAKRAVGGLADVVDEIICQGGSLASYAKRWRLNPLKVVGRLGAALDVLKDHWDTVDAPRKREAGGG